MSEIPSSPVAPNVASRLWSAGASALVSVAVLVVLAALHPRLAAPLLAGALVAGLAAWFAASRPQGVSGEQASESVAVSAHAGLEPGSGEGGLDAVFEALPDPVMVVLGGEADDIAGRRIIMANQAARRALRIQEGYPLLVSVLRDPAVLEAVDEALFAHLARQAEFETAGAQDRIWSVWASPLPADAAGPRALVVLRDETDVRRMERMRVDFLANASHELKTPLASLSGFIETLKGHARDDTHARDRFLDIMGAQADRMARLVADLLSLSRIELNEHIPPSGRVDVARAAADVLDALGVLSREKGVTLEMIDGEAAAGIVGERDEIVQVIQNLVDNAIKYSAPGDAVSVIVRRGLNWETGVPQAAQGMNRLSLLTPDRDDGRIYAGVTVLDHGPGMAREQLPRLTERFYRVEGQKSGERLGTGLGLAIVKHIVNRHRGGLLVESAPGLGSAFTAYFPVVEARRNDEIAPPPAP